jgi:hypothetical protein
MVLPAEQDLLAAEAFAEAGATASSSLVLEVLEAIAYRDTSNGPGLK